MRTDWTELVHCHKFGTSDLRATRNSHCDYVYVRNVTFTHFVCDLACFELQLLQFWPGSAILRTGCCVRRHLGANWKNKKWKAFSKTLTISIKISSRRPTTPTAKSYSIHLTTVGVVHFKVTIIITMTIISHVKFKQLLSLQHKILSVRHTSLGRVYLKLTERSCEVIAEVLRVDRFPANQIVSLLSILNILSIIIPTIIVIRTFYLNTPCENKICRIQTSYLRLQPYSI